LAQTTPDEAQTSPALS